MNQTSAASLVISRESMVPGRSEVEEGQVIVDDPKHISAIEQLLEVGEEVEYFVIPPYDPRYKIQALSEEGLTLSTHCLHGGLIQRQRPGEWYLPKHPELERQLETLLRVATFRRQSIAGKMEAALEHMAWRAKIVEGFDQYTALEAWGMHEDFPDAPAIVLRDPELLVLLKGIIGACLPAGIIGSKYHATTTGRCGIKLMRVDGSRDPEVIFIHRYYCRVGGRWLHTAPPHNRLWQVLDELRVVNRAPFK